MRVIHRLVHGFIHRLIHMLNQVTGNWNVKKRNQLPGAKASVPVT